MIPTNAHVKRADKYVASYESTGANPDLDSRVATYKAVVEGGSDVARAAHARSLMQVVDLHGAPATTDDDGVLRGAALDQALKDAGLSTSGSADEKRQRLAEHEADGSSS